MLSVVDNTFIEMQKFKFSLHFCLILSVAGTSTFYVQRDCRSECYILLGGRYVQMMAYLDSIIDIVYVN